MLPKSSASYSSSQLSSHTITSSASNWQTVKISTTEFPFIHTVFILYPLDILLPVPAQTSPSQNWPDFDHSFLAIKTRVL